MNNTEKLEEGSVPSGNEIKEAEVRYNKLSELVENLKNLTRRRMIYRKRKNYRN